MARADVMTLVSIPTLRTGEISETETTVFCGVKSVSLRETYAAAAVGVKPEVIVTLSESADYAGQPLVRFHDRMYKVHRTYQSGNGLELTLTAPVGLRDAIEICYLGESRVPAWCAVGYIQFGEIDDAGQTGLSKELHLLVNAPAYAGDELVEYSGKKYAVRRTYQEDRDLVDLYVEERAGV